MTTIDRICKNCKWWTQGYTKIVGECYLEMEGTTYNHSCLRWEQKPVK